ncbi:MAG: hypothetical protein AAFZ15_34915, partial [Bacteroidota bacterium]
MKDLSILLLFMALVPQFCCSQNHDYYWPMGYGSFSSDTTFGRTVIDFNESPPLIYREDRDLEFSSTVASYCDSLGNLQFYTNGIRVINREHELVENGDSLNTGPFASLNYWSGYKLPLSEFFLPFPNSHDSVLLFHSSNYTHDTFGIVARTLHRTTLAPLSNGGLGKVVSKNIPLVDNETLSGGKTAVKHGNGRDWWIISAVIVENRYYRMLLSPDGITDIEEFELFPTFPFVITDSYFVFSPDGSKMARYHVANGIYIYDFDRCTGEFENPFFIPMPNTTLGDGVSISPNSRFLYITSALEVFQFDLWADDIAASLDTVAVYDGHTSPFGNHSTFLLSQLGPDGRIYINSPGTSNVLHAVQY